MSPSLHPALERRLAALEKRIGDHTEGILQNFVTINPTTGVTNFNFTGIINALGLIIPAATGASLTSALQNRVEWTDTAGDIIAELFANTTGTGQEDFFSFAFPVGAGDTINNHLRSALSETDANFVEFLTSRVSSGGNLNAAIVTVTGETVIVLDGGGRTGLILNSNGPQLLAFDHGSTNVSIAANAVSGTVASVGHQLGRTPKQILFGNNSNNNVAARYANAGALHFDLTAFWTDGGNTHVAVTPTIDWLALG